MADGGRRAVVMLVLRLVLGVLFVYAGFVKLFDVSGLAVDIANYRVVPQAWVPGLAVTLPGIELVSGAVLLSGRWTRAAAIVVTALLAVFSIAVGQALVRNISLECGCFGAARDPVTGATLVRDLGLLALGAVLVVRGRDAA